MNLHNLADQEVEDALKYWRRTCPNLTFETTGDRDYPVQYRGAPLTAWQPLSRIETRAAARYWREETL